jgi:deazaflavin-dependent oxidoreductase (nitroreductase family)
MSMSATAASGQAAIAMTPPRSVLRVYWALHQAIFDVTRGRVGTMRPGRRRPGTLFLHTIGNRTGIPRRTGLYYVEDGRDLVVVASNAGQDVDPGWYRNLQARPEAEVEAPGGRRRVRARAATEREAARLWPALDAVYGEYAAYRRKTTRAIPVVILEPLDASDPPKPSPPAS